jgi:hypothetical protein
MNKTLLIFGCIMPMGSTLLITNSFKNEIEYKPSVKKKNKVHPFHEFKKNKRKNF